MEAAIVDYTKLRDLINSTGFTIPEFANAYGFDGTLLIEAIETQQNIPYHLVATELKDMGVLLTDVAYSEMDMQDEVRSEVLSCFRQTGFRRKLGTISLTDYMNVNGRLLPYLLPSNPELQGESARQNSKEMVEEGIRRVEENETDGMSQQTVDMLEFINSAKQTDEPIQEMEEQETL